MRNMNYENMKKKKEIIISVVEWNGEKNRATIKGFVTLFTANTQKRKKAMKSHNKIRNNEVEFISHNL